MWLLGSAAVDDNSLDFPVTSYTMSISIQQDFIHDTPLTVLL